VSTPQTSPLSAAFLEQLGFRADLEEAALRCVARLDIAGCRRALGELAARLDVSGDDGRAALVIQLLADVLRRVNERVHGPETDRETYLAHRLALLECFAECGSAHEARRRFLPSLNRLLASLSAGGPSRRRVVLRAIAYIETHYPGRVSLSAVAECLAVSPSYLSRVFRQDTGETLTSYVQRVRIGRAAPLVAEGLHSLSEIADRVGFRSYRDFHRNFVRRTHESPRALRARLARAGPGAVRTGLS
jgi:AraC-like DNA-binding protein